MKKIIKVFIIISLVIFIMMCYMVDSDIKNYNNLKKDIDNKLKIKSNYINYYDNYYIVMDSNYLYLLNKDDYRNILKLENNLIHKNVNNYDIIYKDEKIMYFDNQYIDGKLIYKYYDLYTYEEIESLIVGDNDE